MIEVKSLRISFKRQLVLNDINLSIGSGELLGLLGPSGSGKTTLIRAILGALTCDAGEVVITGKVMPNRDIARTIGYMPQNDALYSEISGRDNLMFFGGLMGLKGEELRSAVADMLQFVNLHREGSKAVMHYSGGMKKRLSLAVALLHDPDILLLDEPTVGIDPLLRKTVRDEFHRLRKNGKTLIITTHVMDEAERCKRVALLHNGSIIADGDVEELKQTTSDGRLESLFLKTRRGAEDDKLNR